MTRLRDRLPRRLPDWQPSAHAVPVLAQRVDVAELAFETLGRLRQLRTGDSTARGLDLTISLWESPYPGWSGRLGPLPGLVSQHVELPRGRGQVSVKLRLAEHCPLSELLGAVVSLLAPTLAMPTTVSSADKTAGSAIAIGPASANREDGPSASTTASEDGQLTGTAAVLDPAPVHRGDERAGLDPMPEGGNGRLTRSAVVVDPATANPRGRERYGQGMARGQLAVTSDGWWRIERPTGLLVAGRVGDPLDERQSATIAEIGSVNLDKQLSAPAGGGAVPASAIAKSIAQLAMTGVVLDGSSSSTRSSATDDAATGGGTTADAANSTTGVSATGSKATADAAVGAAIAELLAPELLAILTEPLPDEADTARLDWEIRSVRQRRAAMRGHAAGLAPGRAEAVSVPGLRRPPSVSALLVTRRPHRVAEAVATLAAQTYPELEIIVGLHGCELAEPLPGTAGRQVTVLPIPAEWTLGEALGEATRAARGSLIAKIDDDDGYGPEHIWDLVLARHYSGATVVGKPAQFVHLANRNLTVHRRIETELFTDTVAGGTMLMGRGDLEALGGWLPVPRHVDRVLLDRVLQRGGLVYRTHGLGFIYVRHAEGHTWQADQDYFLRDIWRSWDGMPPSAEFGARI